MIKIKPSRTYKIPGKLGDEVFYITYKFKYKEDVSQKEIEDIRKAISGEEDFKNTERVQEGLVDVLIRKSIIEQEGFVDEDTLLPLDVSIEDNQKLIYEIVNRDIEHRIAALVAFIGPTGKNSLTGVTQQSSGDGITPVAANAEKVIEQTV